jgi:SIR2-like domain
MDLVEFLSLYPLRAPRIMWFLGAGASVLAGLPTAATLTWESKRALYCNKHRVSSARFPNLEDPAFQSLVQSYFDSEKGYPPLWSGEEYSFYFEKYLPDEGDRRRFLDKQLSGVKPSYAHFCLAGLLALKQTYLVWTTNFDMLVERAAGQDVITSHIPDGLTVISLEAPEKAHEVFRDDRWPALVKLHGDFKYRKLINTAQEVQTQNDVLGNLLMKQCGRWGLAVVGYSGRDHSIMSALEGALKSNPDPFPHGLFWFVRSGEKPHDTVISLLPHARERGSQAAYIEIGGFDEPMVDLFRPHYESHEGQYEGDNPYLPRQHMYRVMTRTLSLYQLQKGGPLSRLVVHKTTPFTKEEIEGCVDALGTVDNLEMLTLTQDTPWQGSRIDEPRDKRNKKGIPAFFPLHRGAMLPLGPFSFLLWTQGDCRGISDGAYFKEGKGIPHPIRVTRFGGVGGFHEGAREIIGLTKMNWNNDSPYDRMPVTISYASILARIVKRVGSLSSTPYDFRYFM